MLAAKREFNVLDERFRTPLIVPSYSSRAADEVGAVIEVTRSFIRGSVLVSAYDICHHGVQQKKLSHTSLIFLDSGGYEAGKQSDFSEIEKPKSKKPVNKKKNWTVGQYRDAVKNWDFTHPTVLVTYDEYQKCISLEKQIARAKKNFHAAPNACHAILLKPEPLGRPLKKTERLYLDIPKICGILDNISDFSIIGVTEKELGNSLFERMKAIATIRNSINKAKLNILIHVFGSLDPISTPVYFLSGADIFDGLTWLRYAYHDGLAIYRQNFIARSDNLPLRIRDGELVASAHLNNYLVLGKLEETMKQYLQNKDFSVFGENEKFFRNAVEKLEEEFGGCVR